MRHVFLLLALGLLTLSISTKAHSDVETLPLNAMTGVWRHGDQHYHFDGRVMTLINRKDRKRGPGTVMLRIEAADGGKVSGQWFTSALRFTPVTGTLAGDTLTLGYSKYSWEMVYTPVKPAQKSAAGAASPPASALAPDRSLSTAEITALQKSLAALGCYDGRAVGAHKRRDQMLSGDDRQPQNRQYRPIEAGQAAHHSHKRDPKRSGGDRLLQGRG